MGQRRSEEARSVAAHHQRRGPRRPRQQDGVVQLVEAALERNALPGEQAADDLEGLLEARHAPVEGQAEGAELGLVPACAEADAQAAAAHLVDRRGSAREQCRLVERGARDERP